MSDEEKINRFNLLPITPAMFVFLQESYPMDTYGLTFGSFDFVKFHQGKPYFYGRQYIQENSIDELLISFARIIQ